MRRAAPQSGIATSEQASRAHAVLRILIRPLLFQPLAQTAVTGFAHAALRFDLPGGGAAVGGPEVTETRGCAPASPVSTAQSRSAGGRVRQELRADGSLSCLGFGFLTVARSSGTADRKSVSGLVALPETQSLPTPMGVPSDGRDRCVERLRRFRRTGTPLFANIGGFSAAEIAASFSRSNPMSTPWKSASCAPT